VNADSRRRILKTLAALVAALPALRPRFVQAQRVAPQTLVIDPGVKDIAGETLVSRGRVKLELPIIADNGNAVPVKITVDSPMTATDYVKSIHLVSERNPVKHMAAFHIGPRAGRAEISSRVRLAGSQTVTAVAELSDGSFWMDTSHIQVTLSACADEVVARPGQ
jgi:sulfur-oxidizing protein SoxY